MRWWWWGGGGGGGPFPPLPPSSHLMVTRDASFSPAQNRMQHFTSKVSVNCESWRQFGRLKDVKSCCHFNRWQHLNWRQIDGCIVVGGIWVASNLTEKIVCQIGVISRHAGVNSVCREMPVMNRREIDSFLTERCVSGGRLIGQLLLNLNVN